MYINLYRQTTRSCYFLKIVKLFFLDVPDNEEITNKNNNTIYYKCEERYAMVILFFLFPCNYLFCHHSAVYQ